MVFFFLYGLVRALPISLFRKTAGPFLHVLIRFAIPRKRVIRNLSGAFGGSYSAATRDGLAKGIQEHFFRNLFDCMLQLADDQHAMKIIRIEGKEHLESRSAKAKVIAFGAHIGNFVLLGRCLGLNWAPVLHTSSNPKRQPDPKAYCNVPPELPPVCNSVAASQKCRNKSPRCTQKNQIVHILGDNLKKAGLTCCCSGTKCHRPAGPSV